jgi:dienelactone hydrolase
LVAQDSDSPAGQFTQLTRETGAPVANTAAITKVTTGKVRLSYAFLFHPRTQTDDNGNEQTPKYTVTLLIPKSDTATMSKLRAAQKQALEDGKSSKFGGSIPKKWVDTIHDGDEEADLEKNPEYAGHFYVTVGNTRKPGIVDRDLQPIVDDTEVYSGCYARVSVNAYPYANHGKKGVSFSLRNVQKWADGEPFAGISRAEDDFDPIDDDDEDDLI